MKSLKSWSEIWTQKTFSMKKGGGGGTWAKQMTTCNDVVFRANVFKPHANWIQTS